MGLNIRAYKGINLVAEVDEQTDICSNHIKIYDFGWSQQAGLKTNGVYSYEDSMTGYS